MKVVILDNGHGKNTPGKRSPIWSDKTQLFEYEFNRDICSRIAKLCEKEGIISIFLVPELFDIPLSERCHRANEINKKFRNECFLISVHANAGGGSGWECFTTIGKTKSDELASLFCDAAIEIFPNEKMRFDYTDKDPDKEEQFYILKNTDCPAILTENFFMDNEKDCRLIMSEEGRQKVAELHFKAIQKIIKK